ncbi:hypothetical protein [Streptomyces sp. SID3343]|uniref:hypothetical protein n=1 Tax=Streptomyces sp. SID3343 TaxID=2690260 RepID=UPI00136C6CE4|nr:hypothetical protein [Streptomyces sp. SID3343]MYW04219.1 hypothetical protein [Streptomyces sp. SID3343]
MPTDVPTPETYPANPRDWTTDDVSRFWAANRKRQVRCRVSGREGRFEAILNSQAHVRFSNGLEFRTHCGNLVVLDDDVASSASATG